VRKLRFAGTLEPEGARDWRLEAELGATVVQPCVVTLAPVTTRIETSCRAPLPRRLAGARGRRSRDARGRHDRGAARALDLSAVMAEALALALPDYPRAPDAEMETGNSRPPASIR
jgi:uncharacterized metal-binding protein YceD (DUF177 family)